MCVLNQEKADGKAFYRFLALSQNGHKMIIFFSLSDPDKGGGIVACPEVRERSA